ncbi:hypothetical protein CASFOL_008825 [Castilleja foliolosa]|uniref:Uncharacterized protein n=1 Tax=Castilleja foliolosa TaxID=1961234 RepID=A0ABD3E251_9LAMI
MAYTKMSCLAIHCIILLLSVEVMMNIPSAGATECIAGLNVEVNCRRSEADVVCWIECQRRFGPKAKAWCRSIGPGYPAQECMCTYTC